MLLTQLRVRDDPPSSRASHGIFQDTLEVLKGLEHQHLVLGHVLALKNPSDEHFDKNKWKTQFCMQQKSGKNHHKLGYSPYGYINGYNIKLNGCIFAFRDSSPPSFWHGLVFVGLGNTWKYQTRHVLKQKTVLSRSCDIFVVTVSEADEHWTSEI